MTLLLVLVLYAIALTVALAVGGVRRASAIAPPAPTGAATRILILGGTGGTGRHLVAQAIERGCTVRALVRNPRDLAIEDPRLEVMQGDVMDYAAVERAVRGQEAVISALGHRRYLYPTRILSAGTGNVLRAMEAHGVRRFVCQTSLGIGDSAGRMGLYYTFLVVPLVLPFYFWDKCRQERAIAASATDWVIVRPGALTNAAGKGAYRHGPGVGSFVTTVRISRADVASFMLDQVGDGAHLGRAVGLCW